MNTNDTNKKPQSREQDSKPELPAYEPPRLTKKRSMQRVTLFSGGGTSAGGVTAGG